MTKNGVFWIAIVLLALSVYKFAKPTGETPTELTYSEFLQQVDKQNVKTVRIEGSSVFGEYRNNEGKFQSFVAVTPKDDSLVPKLIEKGIDIKVQEPADQSGYLLFLFNVLPLLLLLGIWFIFWRQMQMGAGKGMSFGKSRAKLLTESQQKITFSDVAGIDEARGELEEIIEFLKDPKKFTRLGGRIPKGVLLIGSPGTGKTLLAKAIAGEAGVPFFTISGSDFVEMFVGVGASRVRDLFIQGKKNAPCIIFID